MNIYVTSREREVCALLMLGLTIKEIGKRLSVSHRTIETMENENEVGSYGFC